MLKHAKHNESYNSPDQKQQKNQPKLVFLLQVKSGDYLK